MDVIGVIPARYNSTRFPGKPLAEICGKPMIWWVYQQVKKVKSLTKVCVATDSSKIVKVCQDNNIDVIMTDSNHKNHISRLQEVSEVYKADFYLCVNGDEPLIDSKTIAQVVEKAIKNDCCMTGAYRELTDPVETIDAGNIKVITKTNGDVIYMSRMPIPFPKASLLFKYKKYVGIEVFTKSALDFFAKTSMGVLEKIEDIDHLRFIENGITLNFVEIESDSISVDTLKDLEKVQNIIKKNLKEGDDE